MEFYYIIWGGSYILSAIFLFSNKKVPVSAVLIPIIIIAFFIGYRVDIGADWWNYVYFYNTGDTLERDISQLEPLQRVSRWAIYSLGFRYEVFFFIFAIFTMYSIVYVAKKNKISNLFFVLLIYISTIFCSYQMNILRSGIMASCIWIAVAFKIDGQPKKSYLWGLIGGGFHFGGLFFIPVLYLVDKVLNKKFVFALITIALVSLSLKLGQKIESIFPVLAQIERVSNYLDADVATEYGLSLGSLFNFCIFIFFFIKHEEDYYNNRFFRSVINMLFLGVVFISIFNMFGTVVTRLGQVMNMSIIFLLPYVVQKMKSPIWKSALFMILSAYLVMYYNKAFVPLEELGYSRLFPFKYEFTGFFR